MSAEKTAVEVKAVSTEAGPSAHTAAAQSRILEVRAMREIIPNFIDSGTKTDAQRIISSSAVPPEFIEIVAAAIGNEPDLRRETVDTNRVRDLMDYAQAYGPVADEFEAMAHFLRHSINVARSTAGNEALSTYALAKHLVRRPAMARLVPYVADMSRALGARARMAKIRAAARKQAAGEAEKKDGTHSTGASPTPLTEPPKP
jgi:hypothetical protein